MQAPFIFIKETNLFPPLAAVLNTSESATIDGQQHFLGIALVEKLDGKRPTSSGTHKLGASTPE